METEPKLHPELREILDPRKCAILVVDIQGSYCDPTEVLPTLLGSGTENLRQVIPKLEQFINTVRRYGILIIWTKMIENPALMPENLKRKMEIDGTPSISTPNTKGFDLLLQPKEGDIEIVKNHYNAFTGTDLDNILRGKGINTLIIVGGYTSRCVSATVLMASDHLGYDVVVPRDLVGVPEAYANEHQTALGVIDSILGYVLDSGKIISAWEEPSK